MLNRERWTERPIEDIERTAREMNEMCWHGECPIIMDSMSSCPVMELCQKSCADIREADWERWLKNEAAQASA